MIDFQLHGKTALVTGASRGLGQGMIIGLAKAGADIIGVGISDMTETRDRVEALGRKFYPIQQDLSLPNSVEAVLDQAFQYTKRIDTLVNNDGINSRSPAV